jgi:2-hydroxymuconate-semialdehyde hydrolase
LSGALVLKAAAANKRVGGVVTTGTMGVAAQRKAGSRGWAFPEDAAQIRQHAERTVVDPSLITDEEIARRRQVLEKPGYRDYFNAMFSRPADEYAALSAVTAEELAAIGCPVVLMHGAEDRSFTPESTSIALARQLADADVVIFSKTAHSVALEQPHKLLDVAVPFFKRCLK